MLKINNLNIKSLYSINTLLTKYKNINNIDGNILEINKILNLNLDENKIIEFINVGFKYYNKFFIKYYTKVLNEFNNENFIKYCEFKKNNPFDRTSINYFNAIYGEKTADEEYKKNNEKIKEKLKNRSLPYTIEYWMNKDYTKNEAIIKIQEYKSNKATTLKNFIKKHGKEVGTEKFNKWVDKCKNTKEKYKEKYKEKWEEEWKKYLKTKDSSSYNWALKKSNDDEELAQKFFNDKTKKTIQTFKNFILRYGRILGVLKWKKHKRKKDNSSLKYFLKKYNGDEEIANLKYNETNKKKDSGSLNYFLRKHKNDLLAAYMDYEKFKKYVYSFKYFYDNSNQNINIAKQNYDDHYIKLKNKIYTASLSSLKILQPLHDNLIKEGYENSDIFIGFYNKKEFYIKTEQNKKYFYDFTILSKKIIIEYNGSYWHPNYEKYETDYLNKNFKNHILLKNNNYTPDKIIEYDKHKINIAKEKEFDVLILWEDDGYDHNIKKLNKYLKNKNIL